MWYKELEERSLKRGSLFDHHVHLYFHTVPHKYVKLYDNENRIRVFLSSPGTDSIKKQNYKMSSKNPTITI
jgi:hypothetical protein